ncbi:C-type lectin 37Db [Hyalella azteca]|uniref:C-type lectin 37Db n=1 Tax=Hyalella azteca TaxID=294128 RepID=A0A8B7NJC0_HYAAZ|nr:C-type lectin 37Db [Hyalella azteca]
MPLINLAGKQYYLGIFFKANWYKAAQYCRFHGMHLAAIENERENRVLEAHIQDAGLGHEHFWTSGTDQGEEGRFFWLANGRPVTFENWNAGEPNNFQYEDGEKEHCLELWNRDGKGLKWNDSPCSFETFFLCEVQ